MACADAESDALPRTCSSTFFSRSPSRVGRLSLLFISAILRTRSRRALMRDEMVSSTWSISLRIASSWDCPGLAVPCASSLHSLFDEEQVDFSWSGIVHYLPAAIEFLSFWA